MKKLEIARKMARRTGISQGEAADRVDGVVRQILSRLRKGQDANLPGLGRFRKGSDGALRFDRQAED